MTDDHDEFMEWCMDEGLDPMSETANYLWAQREEKEEP